MPTEAEIHFVWRVAFEAEYPRAVGWPDSCGLALAAADAAAARFIEIRLESARRLEAKQ